jgi:hypothetical protein
MFLHLTYLQKCLRVTKSIKNDILRVFWWFKQIITIMGHHGHPMIVWTPWPAFNPAPRDTKDEHGPGCSHGDQLGASTWQAIQSVCREGRTWRNKGPKYSTSYQNKKESGGLHVVFPYNNLNSCEQYSTIFLCKFTCARYAE